MAYSPYAPVRRSRRRRWLMALLVLIVVVSVIALAVRYRTEQRGVTEYLAVAEDAVTVYHASADDLEALLGSLADVDRPEVLRRLAALEESAASATTELAEVAVAVPVAEAHGFLSSAGMSWAMSLAKMDDAIVSILDEPLEADGEGRLTEAFDLLRIGDLAYAQFLLAMEEVDPDLVNVEFPPLAFAASDRSVAYDSRLMVLRISSVYKLGENRDISITALTDPEPLGTRDNIPVVPFSEDFVVQAVVANEGNETEARVTVVLDLVPTDDGDDPVTLQQSIATLEPGQARTLVFDVLSLRPGGLYELKVAAEIEDDSDMENNSWRLVFYRNENA